MGPEGIRWSIRVSDQVGPKGIIWALRVSRRWNFAKMFNKYVPGSNNVSKETIHVS